MRAPPHPQFRLEGVASTIEPATYSVEKLEIATTENFRADADPIEKYRPAFAVGRSEALGCDINSSWYPPHLRDLRPL
jgi:hypothetical protein